MGRMQTRLGGASDERMSKRWYIVHAYSNFERKVAEAIKDRAKAKFCLLYTSDAADEL